MCILYFISYPHNEMPQTVDILPYAKQGMTHLTLSSLLTHLPLEKMATILADDIFKCNFLNKNDKIPIQISLKLVSRSPIDNKPALVQGMALCRTGKKPLPKPMMAEFTDTCMQHQGEMN